MEAGRRYHVPYASKLTRLSMYKLHLIFFFKEERKKKVTIRTVA